ncbi:MAG: N-6 DNA methylase [Alphaproteobacteria bacterium]|nr:N-6 DNA methylase [Alphaproteobacteria bacterium]
MTENNLVTKVWNYASVLAQSGIGYTDYVSQLTYLLFLKMDEERTDLLKEESLLPADCRWSNLLKLSGTELSDKYQNILDKLSKQTGIIGTIYKKAGNKISNPANLSRLISLINGETWMGLDIDVKGEIYEGLLQKNAQESKAGAGQYFTPRPLIRAMVEVMHPTPDTTVVDPACGTGGFLLIAYEYMKKQTQDREKIKALKEKKLFGTDITPLVVSLCAMNMYLHGIGGKNSPVTEGDSLMNAGDKRYDMVLTNPPFGKKGGLKIMGEDGSVTTEKEEYNRDDFIATTSNKQLNFVQHIMTILNTHGRAAVVVPDNVLFEGGAGEKIRRRLLNEFNLHTVLRLPTGIFYAQGVKANVIFFDKYPPLDKGHRTNDVWFYDLRTNMNLSLVTNSLNDSHLADFIKCYNADNIMARTESERFKKFSYDEIIKRDKVSLDITWLKDESLESLENLPEPEILADEIVDNLETALNSFKNVMFELQKAE